MDLMSDNDLEAMRPGARAAVTVCMGVKGHDSVFVLSDEATLPIGHLLAEEAARICSDVRLRLLEEYGPRPIVSLPEALRSDLLGARPTVTLYAATSQPGEITFRFGLGVFMRNDLSVRHGHMIGVTPEIMLTGMLADYDLVWYVTHHVYEQARLARRIQVRDRHGTDLEACFESWLRWVPCDGRYHKAGDWGNLPEGETFTSPSDVNGILAAQVLGDHFGQRYGALPEPIRFEIANGVVVKVHGPSHDITDDVVAYLDSAENGRRVGEFAIGTNVALSALVGNMLQDEKIPGVHLAFGHPYPEQTGAQWASPVHVDAVAPFSTVIIDDRLVLDQGRFVDLPPDVAATVYGQDSG